MARGTSASTSRGTAGTSARATPSNQLTNLPLLEKHHRSHSMTPALLLLSLCCLVSAVTAVVFYKQRKVS
jgi:hypothetical protein